MGKSKGKIAKRLKQLQKKHGEDEKIKSAPHSIVVTRGVVGRPVKTLAQNFRRVMAPYTAEQLKERKSNKLKDFINVAGLFSVSHMVMFTKSTTSVNMRICRLPRGPTLTFKINSYCLMKDLARVIKKYDDSAKYFLNHSLLVMNNFSKDKQHLKLTSSMFQNMFPSININEVKLKMIKRITLVNYDSEKDQIQLRHYLIRVVPTGISRSVSKMNKKRIPKLNRYSDISEFLLDPGALSESEAELDADENQVKLPQPMSGKGNAKHEQSAIRLREIGPRLTLTLNKIVSGLCDGETLYNRFSNLTEKQKKEIQLKRQDKLELKKKRREEQNERVKQKNLPNQKLEEGEDDYIYDHEKTTHSDDDADYYQQEVGAVPDKDLFEKRKRKKLSPAAATQNKKKRGSDGKSRHSAGGDTRKPRQNAGGDTRKPRQNTGGDTRKPRQNTRGDTRKPRQNTGGVTRKLGKSGGANIGRKPSRPSGGRNSGPIAGKKSGKRQTSSKPAFTGRSKR